MENGTQALMMAFAAFIFVIALTVTFTTLAQAKQTADVVLYYSDRDNFQELVEYQREDGDGGRKVGIDTVIATVSRCIREKFYVKIIDKNGVSTEFEYDTSTKEEIDNKIKDFINSFVDDYKDAKFIEKFVEVTIDGKTYDAGDGTSLEEDVGKKLYITYTYYKEQE